MSMLRRSRSTPLAGVAVLVLLASALSGCSPFPVRSAPLVVYSPDVAVPQKSGAASVDWQLVVARPTAERALSSPRIAVRPGPSELQVLAGARWSDSAPELVQTLVLRALEDSGRIIGVGRQSSAMRAEYVLMLDLRAFEAVYPEAGAPRADIELGAKLLSLPDNRILAATSFAGGAPADSREAAAVVAAFEQALEPLLGELVDWVLETGDANATSVPMPTETGGG